MGSPSRKAPFWRCKQDRKAKKASRTSGASKGGNCVCNSVDRYMASTARSYKSREYAEWARHKMILNRVPGVS